MQKKGGKTILNRQEDNGNNSLISQALYQIRKNRKKVLQRNGIQEVVGSIPSSSIREGKGLERLTF
jgi:hypothetical protein